MSSAVDTAVLALLRAVPNLNVWDGDVGDADEQEKTISAPLPYVVLYSTPGRPTNGRLGARRGRAAEFQVTFVGKTREQAKWAAEKVDAALDNAHITIAGRGRQIRRSDDISYVRRDDVWTRPDGGPLFTGPLRYVVHAR